MPPKKIIVIDDETELDDLAEEIVIMQETTKMPWKQAIMAVLGRYEREA
jgi:hypothetical protein